MNNDVKVEVFGTKELAGLFDELTKVNQNKILKGGFRKSGNIILKEAKGNWLAGKKNVTRNKEGKKYPPKRIERAFRMTDIKEGSDITGVNVGNTSYLARWMEKGTKSRITEVRKRKLFIKKERQHSTGRIMGIHFLEKATESKGEEALNSLYINIRNSFEMLIKKYSK